MTLILNSFLMTIFGTLPRMVSTEHTVACPHIHGVLSHSHHNGNPPTISSLAAWPLTLTISGLSSPVNPLGQLNRDVEDDGDIFETLELPLERDSGSSSPGSPPPPVSDPVPDTHARIVMGPGLQRSRTLSGAPRSLRPNNRSPGLPPPDPGPLGDNIYEWLHKSEKPLRTKISEEDLDDLEKLKQRGGGQPSEGYLEKDSLYLSYQIALGQRPGVAHNSDPRYVKLPGEDFYGSDAYVKLDIIPSDPQYHYPNLEPTKG